MHSSSADLETPAGERRLPRVGYLGPAGTFSEEALLASAEPGAVEPIGLGTIYETVAALREGAVEWAIVPIENSLDGSISVTLDLLAGDAGDLEIVGEVRLSVEHSLIARAQLELAEIKTVLTHPQVPGQCERLLRGELAHAKVLPANSTAEAVRIVTRGREASRADDDGVTDGAAALGTTLAARIYGGTVIREGVQDRDDNETRFVWLARAGAGASAGAGELRTGASVGGGSEQMGAERDSSDRRGGPPLRRVGDDGEWKTSLMFWGAGADSPGWLVQCLNEFGQREINLTKIESRPKRERMGSYMFFVDLQGRLSDAAVAEAVAGLEGLSQETRVLGSYRADGGAVPRRRTDAAPSAGKAEKPAVSDRRDGSVPSLHSGATDG
jgi:prephenate dehydratase